MVRVSLLVFSVLYSASALTALPEFEVLPRVCIAPANTSCRLQLNIAWQHSQAVCITTSSQLTDAIHCQRGAGHYQWSAVFSENVTLYLLAQSDGTVLAQRQIKLLRPVQTNVQQRRSSWSIF